MPLRTPQSANQNPSGPTPPASKTAPDRRPGAGPRAGCSHCVGTKNPTPLPRSPSGQGNQSIKWQCFSQNRVQVFHVGTSLARKSASHCLIGVRHSPGMRNIVTVDAQSPGFTEIGRAAEILRAGGLVAFPTETVYGLGAHALDAKAVRKIFLAKERPTWDPLIVHIRDLAMARPLMKRLSPQFELLASRFWPGPLTVVVEKADQVPGEVTAHRNTVALRMPWHPVAAALLATAALPIAAPSANRFGRPSPTRAEHVVEDLGDHVDLILDAGSTPLGVESTVLDLTQSRPVILRPGGISREDLEKAIGAVELAGAVSDEAASKGLASP